MTNIIGKPPKFKSPEHLQDKVDAYFASCYDLEGKLCKAITVTGLALALDTTRRTLLDYQADDDYTDILVTAKSRCEEFAESQLFIGKNPGGAAFALKNNYKNWSDKQDVNLGGQKDNPVEANLTVTFVTPS